MPWKICRMPCILSWMVTVRPQTEKLYFIVVCDNVDVNICLLMNFCSSTMLGVWCHPFYGGSSRRWWGSVVCNRYACLYYIIWSELLKALMRITCWLLYCTVWVTGKDATNDFEDVGHSDAAREMMEKYYIGDIDPSTVPLKRTYTPPQSQYNPDKTSEFVIKILQFLVPLLILGLAFVVRNYTKKE